MTNLNKYIKKRTLLTIGTILILCIVLFSTYKLFNKNPISVTYTSGGNKVNILNYIETDLNKVPINIVKVKNNSDKTSNIKLRVVEDNNFENNLDKTNFSYMIDDGDIKDIEENGELITLNLEKNEEKELNIRIWIKESVSGKDANLVFYIESTK